MTTPEREKMQQAARRAIRFVLAWQDMGGAMERLFRILYPTPILAREADPYIEAVAKVGKAYEDFAAALHARLLMSPEDEGSDAATSEIALALRMYRDPWMQSAIDVLFITTDMTVAWCIDMGFQAESPPRKAWVSDVADFFAATGKALQEEYWAHQKDRRPSVLRGLGPNGQETPHE